MKGLIAFCDILGYQSFLENNSANDVVEKVLSIINKTPAEIKTKLDEKWNEICEKKVAEFKNVPPLTKHLVFSDTIVIMLEYQGGIDETYKKAAIIYMTLFSLVLKRQMFLAGLPLRCVIHEGEFFHKDMCFAGKAVVEAYKLVGAIDLSAIVFSEELGKYITNAQQSDNKIIKLENDEYLFVNYLTPMKGPTEKKLLHVNWIVQDDGIIEKCKQDVESFVLNSFWSHKKDCPISVDNKIAATSKLVRRLLLGKPQEEKPTPAAEMPAPEPAPAPK